MNGSSYMANENFNIIASSSPINLTNIINTNYSKDSSGISSSFSNADLLKCGSCLTEFLLSDIVIFIQHKTKSCKQLDHSCRNRDKENYLKCNLCSESFGNAYDLLEHVQYLHKIELFKEIASNTSNNFQGTTNFSNNCNLPSKSIRNKTISGNFQTTTQLMPNNSTTNIGLNLSKSNTSSNEIFIDVIPSDPTIDFSDKNQSYNITVSSNSSTSSSSSSSNNKLSHAQVINESLSRDKQQYKSKQNKEIFTKISETTIESNQDVVNYSNNNNSNNSNFGSDAFNDNSSSSSNYSQNNKEEESLADGQSTQMTIKEENESNNNNNNNNDNNNTNINGIDDSNNVYSSISSSSSSKRKKSTSSNKQGSSFFCDVCKASFNQKIHLTKHSAKHTGIKPFKCTECNYSTVERSHLKVHVRVHTGEKPFKCTFCEYATAQSSTLKIHKKRHHDNLDESNQKSRLEKNYETLSGTISSLLSNDASKININTSSILPPIFSLLPSTKSNNDEQNIANENSINNDLKDNNKNETTQKTNSTTTNSTVGQENSDIYKNKKNLPPMKRFKIFHHLNSTHSVDEPQNLSLKVESSNDSNNNNNNNNSSSNINNINHNSNSSSSDNSTENKQENNDNKLLGLANIALERETN